MARETKKWGKNVLKEIKKDPKKTIPIIFLSPFLIYAFAEVLIGFSPFALVGYCVACVYGFSKILEDPYRIVKWGAGYAIGASVTPLILSSALPQITEGTWLSILSALVIIYVVVAIFLKARELRKS